MDNKKKIHSYLSNKSEHENFEKVLWELVNYKEENISGKGIEL